LGKLCDVFFWGGSGGSHRLWGFGFLGKLLIEYPSNGEKKA
jgi:hypothetical protein